MITFLLHQLFCGINAAETVNLTVIHTNDVHAYATEFKERFASIKVAVLLEKPVYSILHCVNLKTMNKCVESMNVS